VRWARSRKDPRLLSRALIVRAVASGRSAGEVASWLECSLAHVYRTVTRFAEAGRQGLVDGRALNGPRLVDDAFAEGVRTLLAGIPRDHGFLRNTWTRELLAIVMEQSGHARVSVCTMGRVLKRVRARRGRPKPVVKCPLSDRQKRRRLKGIEDLITNCPASEVVVYEDEVDIHLNPKIGLDWMNRGTQRLVMTPGKNAKAYVAGALDAHSREVIWVGGADKNSDLFVAMLRKLDGHYPQAAAIHVVLDNYGIHKSAVTKVALREMPRIKLHFLPPYCPDHNSIERLWLDLHATVTRNHRHGDIIPLCADVAQFLNSVTPWVPGARPRTLLVA